eukprot:2247848-Amphidinium_carterae.1
MRISSGTGVRHELKRSRSVPAFGLGSFPAIAFLVLLPGSRLPHRFCLPAQAVIIDGSGFIICGTCCGFHALALQKM